MLIPIKQALLEGYTLEAIVEAVHANHPHLNKSRFKEKKLKYSAGKEIEQNRSALAKSIRDDRSGRDFARSVEISTSPENPLTRENARNVSNYSDNAARTKSQNGLAGSGVAKEMLDFSVDKRNTILSTIPRIVSSARQ